MTGWLVTGAVLFTLGVSFLLSGMEAGVFALSRIRVRRLARQGDGRAALLQRYLENPENFLWTIVVGNTLAASVVVAVVTLHLEVWFAGRPVAFTAACVALLLGLFVFVDLLPKLLFRRFPNRLSLRCVGMFRILHRLLSPIVGITEWISRGVLRLTRGQAFTGRLFGSRAELRAVIEDSSQSLSREEQVMINRILDLQNLRVGDVMTPMANALTMDSGATVDDLLGRVRERPVSIVPLWKGIGRGRRILGVVALTRVLLDEPAGGGSAPLETLVQPALYVRDGTRLEEALRLLRRGRQRLAIVLDAQSREAGVVTLNDILRPMFGEVRL